MTSAEQSKSTDHIHNAPLANWHLGRLSPMPLQLPEGWQLVRLTSVATLESGHTPSRRHPEYWDGGIAWISLHDSTDLDVPVIRTTAQTISQLGLDHSSARLLPQGTVIFSRTASVGKSAVMGLEMATSQDFANYICGSQLHNFYLMHLFRFMAPEWKRLMAGTTHNTIYMPVFQELQILLPPIKEQEAIAEALNDADALINALEQLITKKSQVKEGTMHDLLMGKRRLPQFKDAWVTKRIEEIAFPSSEKNSAAQSLPVLTCSKHLGFVNSLGYFKNQVFSRDTSGYKVIKHGQIGYPANHIEEGSIGLQDLYDIALVSPIYVVFSVMNEVNSYFLHRLLKLETYRQKFETATTASFDRRGSLRWRPFSQITVSLPSIEEQTAIAEILSDMDAEIAALEGKLSKARQVKQGMMQELLTGRVRLI